MTVIRKVTIADLQSAIDRTEEKIRGVSASQINPRFRLAAIKAQNHRQAMLRKPTTNKATV